MKPPLSDSEDSEDELDLELKRYQTDSNKEMDNRKDSHKREQPRKKLARDRHITLTELLKRQAGKINRQSMEKQTDTSYEETGIHTCVTDRHI